MFVALLDDARKSSSQSNDLKAKPVRTSNPGNNNEEPQTSVLEKLSEYLFDLFDANLMDDFKTIEAFERRAQKSFEQHQQTEYTIQQHSLHMEFLELFEQLIDKFLHKEGYNAEYMYDQISKYQQSNLKNDKESSFAQEVIDVIFAYSNFELWADNMKQQVKEHQECITFRDQLAQAYKDHSYGYKGQNPSDRSSAHRFDSAISHK